MRVSQHPFTKLGNRLALCGPVHKSMIGDIEPPTGGISWIATWM